MMMFGPGEALLLALLLAGLALLAVVAVRLLAGGGGPAGGAGGAGGGRSAARQILDERYARGELTTEEYTQRVRVLGEAT